MPIFGKRREAQLAEERRQETLRRSEQEAQDMFTRGFLAWLDEVSRAQTETACAALTDDILARSGPVPPYLTADLNQTQRIMMGGFARSYAAASMERVRAAAVVAAARARDNGTGDESGVRNVISYWASVDTYLGAVLR